jgi:3-oxoacyl-[acyl-carrier protein] reductase
MALAGEGVNVTINGLSEENLARTAGEIRSASGVEVVPVVADINTADGRRRLLEACPAPDILVNNNWGLPRGDGRNSSTRTGCRQWRRTCWLRS